MLYGQIEAFLEVARSGTVRAAADRLFLSQPALSARIAALEKELDVRLFDRRRTGMSLSVAGKAFLPHAERAEQAINAGVRIAREVAAGTEGEVMIGSGPAVSAYVMPELIAQFQESCPEIQVHFRVGPSSEIVPLVAQRQLHIGLTMPLTGHDVNLRNIYRTELSLIRAAGYPFDETRPERATLILMARPSTYFRLAQELYRNLGLEPRHVIEVDGVEAAKRMVQRGLGVALLPSTATAIEIESGELLDIPIPELLPISRITAVVEPKQQEDWLPLDVLRSLIQRIPEMIPGTYPLD